MTTNAESFFSLLPTAAEVESLIGKSEDLYFDAKTIQDESFTAESAKGPLAKAISAFANSDGGVIVYGLEARPDKDGRDVVIAKRPVKDIELVRSKILALLGQVVQPPVEGIIVESRSETDKSGYVLVFVPPSDTGPHRSRQQHEYFRRHGSSSFPMEHYELEEMFGRRRRPNLGLYWEVRHQRFGNPQEGYCAVIHIGLRNTGRAIAKYPGLLLKNCKRWLWGVDGNGNWGLPVLPASKPNHVWHGGTMQPVIYPGVDLDVTAIAHTVRLPQKIGAPTMTCEDLTVEYEIYAEDMPTIKSVLRIEADDIIQAVLSR